MKEGTFYGHVIDLPHFLIAVDAVASAEGEDLHNAPTLFGIENVWFRNALALHWQTYQHSVQIR